MKKLPAFGCTFLSVVLALAAYGQVVQPGRDHLDSILERRTFTPTELNNLDLGGGTGGAKDGKVDVRDLVIFFNQLRNNADPVEASFETGETLAFVSQQSVTLPIVFSKPVTGTLRFDLGGTAEAGADKDFTLAQNQLQLTNATRAQLVINIRPWRGMGGEKVVRLTLSRQPTVIPANGTFSSHMLRLRQFEQGEFVGMLTFPPESTLPSLPVRLGLAQGGSGYCSFQMPGTLLGTGFAFAWQPGASGFPNLNTPIALTLPGSVFGRAEGVDISASLAFQRLSTPFPPDLQEYLAGFPPNDQPAPFSATFTFQNLFAAGDAAPPSGPNPYAVVFQGRLMLQPVRYAPVAP